MIFWAAYALAQEPQSFPPMPADVRIDSKTYEGILVDEATFAELGQLRLLKKENEAKLQAFSEWRLATESIRAKELSALRDEFQLGQDRLTEHYESELKSARRQGFIQQQGFSLGIAIGIVGATALYLGATGFYGQVLTSTIP